jgi:hypothetical protein
MACHSRISLGMYEKVEEEMIQAPAALDVEMACRELVLRADERQLEAVSCWRRPKTEPLLRVVPTQN